jgi:4-amino-4-deoxy-L-arabinose transferase-like glycosyltransferase
VTRAHSAAVLTAALGLFVASLLTAPYLPLFDPDEGYYPATASESLHTGSPWDLRFNGDVRWEKPVLSYALIQGAFAVLGETTLAARLPSAIQGALLVVIVGTLVARLAGGRAGVLSAAVVSSMLGLQIFARAAHPEIAVVLGVTSAELLICLWLSRQTPDLKWTPVLAGVAIGYGVLAKGPVAVALPALMIGCALPWIRRALPPRRAIIVAIGVSGIVAAAVVLPWYAAMTWRHGLPFLEASIWRQNVMRYTTTTFGHHGSIGFFILPTLVGLLPWPGVLPGALGALRTRLWDSRQLLAVCMASSAVSAFVFYSLSVSKLANYTLAILPPLAILIGRHLDEASDRPTSRLTRALPAGALARAALMFSATPLIVDRLGGARVLIGGVPGRDEHGIVSMLWPAVIPAALVVGIAAVVVAVAGARGQIMALVTVGLLAPLSLIYGLAPLLERVYPWHAFGDTIRAQAGPVWMLDYRAPSLTFYAGRPVESLEDLEGLRRTLATARAGWLVLEKKTYDDACEEGVFGEREVRLTAVGGRMALVRLEK